MNKIPLIENACRELLTYGVRGRREKCKELLKCLLLRRTLPGEDPIFWPTGLLAAGLWHCREELAQAGEYGAAGNTAREGFGDGPEKDALAGMIDGALAAYYGRWIKKGRPFAVLDDLLAGETLLNMYQCAREGKADFGKQLSEAQMKCAVEELATCGLCHPADTVGSFRYRPLSGEKTVFADGTGLACPFLYQYGETFGEQEYKELAVLQIVNFLSYGMDGKTGLPYHGYDMADGCKYGIIGWGRAVGWLLRGMAGCMASEYGRERLGESYTALVNAALAAQRPDGCFSWQLEALEGPADTSAAGMICAAVKRGMGLGILAGEKYEKALAAGRRGLERYVRGGWVYQCSGECEGFSRYPQSYGAYPWSLGPALEVF